MQPAPMTFDKVPVREDSVFASNNHPSSNHEENQRRFKPSPDPYGRRAKGCAVLPDFTATPRLCHLRSVSRECSTA